MLLCNSNFHEHVCVFIQHFLTSEGKDGDIQEVKTLLNKAKHYLPKASINQLSSRVRDQEAELQRLISKCQKREKELGTSLQQLKRYGINVNSDILITSDIKGLIIKQP